MDDRGYSKFFTLLENGLVKNSLLAFISKKTLYAFFIGIDQDTKFLNERPVDYFYYEVMKWCVDKGVERFDWMGAGTNGVRDFKQQYGGELVDFGMYHFDHSPIKYKITKSGFKLFQKQKGFS